jgi:hypothetical protein
MVGALRQATPKSSVGEVAWTAFLNWARGYDDPSFDGRSRVAHEAWLEGLSQPVLRLDSAHTREELRDTVLSWEPRSCDRLGADHSA